MSGLAINNIKLFEELEREFFKVTQMIAQKKRMLKKFNSPTFEDLRIRLNGQIDELETKEIELFLTLENF